VSTSSARLQCQRADRHVGLLLPNREIAHRRRNFHVGGNGNVAIRNNRHFAVRFARRQRGCQRERLPKIAAAAIFQLNVIDCVMKLASVGRCCGWHVHLPAGGNHGCAPAVWQLIDQRGGLLLCCI
jgi:hypothetical protein